MIDQLILPPELAVLDKLPATFFLCGSRRMAQRWSEWYHNDPDSIRYPIKISNTTDYDFYTTYTKPTLKALLANDFIPSSPSEYYNRDTEVVEILVRDNVQVVLRKDAEFYRRVFENIDVSFYYTHLWKSSPARPDVSQIGPIFNMLFQIAHASKEK